ncbi:hypothetical protein Rleg4DRAFT_2460 [Rhizobium leguminosarum bv. trifolii WSM2297]|uniref:Uncharacterized protein n=1 Tax=Rhizobium leguminosarum bv. trifolii WSM2297 TaxID=754762 RepID=J0KT65_RHILT|nr:hypothetical protein [Rhizobium leguminosarum]EJC80799.1 hypothetical protein Rleg4DRAFT_2460 [Rhizobium leguminosarum bv. trifolii WSM2297]
MRISRRWPTLTGIPASGEDPIPGFRKDQKLDRLAERFNVAQFVSFGPGRNGPTQQYARLAGASPNPAFPTVNAAIEALFARSVDGTVNIRSFSESDSQSREFLYALATIDDVVSAIHRISSEGAYTIANETIDVSDGGVSGVAVDGLVEFRPDATPRGVEAPGFASLPLDWAASLFKSVYGVNASLEEARHARVEFSLHPVRRGWRQSHLIFWEYGEVEHFDRSADVVWPNDFSRMIGDKAYGLLIANLIGVPVPKTTVLGRRVAPFSFGTDTGSAERWIRTSPVVQVPGKFTTAKGWLDPFKLVQDEDPDGTALASILSQHSVTAVYSGAAIEGADGEFIVEGAAGWGEGFMLGTTAPQVMPEDVVKAVSQVRQQLNARLGSVRFEWVFDGVQVWVVQLHTGASQSAGRALVPGEAEQWVTFNVYQGLEALRDLIRTLPVNTGIQLDGAVGRTSHIADVVRKANVPTRLL